MSFLTSVSVPKSPGGTGFSPSSGGFLGSIQRPADPVAAQFQQEQEQQAQIAKTQQEHSNSLGGFLKDQVQTIPDQFNAGVEMIKAPFKEKAAAGGKGVGPVKAAEGALQVGSGIITAATSPLAPIFDKIGKAINFAGEKLSDAPALQAYGKAYANQPAEQQTTAERALTDIINAANIGMAILGGAEGVKAVTKPAVKGGFLETTAKPEVSAPEVQPKAPEVQQKTLKQTHSEYARAQGYEPYTSPEDLPVIDYGKKGKSTLPEIQTEPKTKAVKGDFTIEPITETPAPIESSRPSIPFSQPKEEGAAPLTPAASLGPTAKSTLGVKVEANAIADKLTKGFEDLPEYNKVNWHDQAQFASDFVLNEPNKAMRVAMGEEPAPAHILPEAVFTAVENAARKVGDVDTLRKLATKSKLVSEGTAMGQRIGILSQRDELSPVSAIKRVAKARAKPERLVVEVKNIKNEVVKATSKRPKLEEFINELKCGY